MIELRHHQAAALPRVQKALSHNRFVLIAGATGCGKTILALVAASRAVGPGGHVLWLAYQREVAEHAAKELRRLQGAGIIDGSVRFTFSTIQSAACRRMPQGVDLIVVDEAHHLHGSNKYWQWVKRRQKSVLGLTGTPRRSARSDGWHIAYHVSRAELTPQHLASMIPLPVSTDFTPKHVDTTHRFYGADFDEATYEALDRPERNRVIAKYLAERRDQLGQTLVFVHRTAHCESLTDACHRYGLRAAFVHSKMDNASRLRVLRDFAAGHVQILVNARLAAEGMDFPNLKTIALAVPTLSDIRFAQMIGRGTRKTKSKRFFFVVDFRDNLGRFGRELEGRYLYEGSGCSTTASGAPRQASEYVQIRRGLLDQPYVAELTRQLVRGMFLERDMSGALEPNDVELALHSFAERQGVPMSIDGARPLEVALVHQWVAPLVADLEGAVEVRKEMSCVDQGRADLVIDRPRSVTVVEYGVRREDITKARQLLRYVRHLRRYRRGKRVEAVLVTVSYEGDATSRDIIVDGEPIRFMNWHDYLRALCLGTEEALAAE